MKVQYDEKITLLTTKIRETEMERDKVLSSLGKSLPVRKLRIMHWYGQYVFNFVFAKGAQSWCEKKIHFGFKDRFLEFE